MIFDSSNMVIGHMLYVNMADMSHVDDGRYITCGRRLICQMWTMVDMSHVDNSHYVTCRRWRICHMWMMIDMSHVDDS